MMNSVWGKIITALVAGALISGLAVATYFLKVSNDKLEQRVEELRLNRDNLVTEVEKAQAEGERLKAEALENDVFLGN